MLRLASTTDPAWLAHALAHLDAVLVDHAHCEHKASVNALALVSRYPDDADLVLRLSELAGEEADHLKRVAAICFARGLSLNHPQSDPYAVALSKLVRKKPHPDVECRMDRLLVAALIEARSCERLQLLAENLDDAALRAFYTELWTCEARHHMLFVELAEGALVRAGVVDARARVDARLAELALAEAAIVAALPLRAAIH
jgi:tRNA-(ms[2]io[6]A)-hydroxylase